jgi:uncharacterized membrane protein
VSEIRQVSSPVNERPGSGWLVFSAALLLLSGVSKILDALWAFKFDEDLGGGAVRTVIFDENLEAWGWVWLVLGIVLIVAAFAVLRGADWARWVGVTVGILTGALAMMWIFYQPFWAILTVALAILVVYALTVYGGSRPLADERYD